MGQPAPEVEAWAVIQPYSMRTKAAGEAHNTAEQGAAPDCQKPTLVPRCGFRQQVSLGVRLR
jgi:hypothetical protein